MTINNNNRFVANSELGFVVTFPAISIGPGFVGVVIVIIIITFNIIFFVIILPFCCYYYYY
jgi:hypothetical protein